MSEHTDELVDVEYVAKYADAVVAATLMELGGAFYAASDHSVPEGTGDVADVYRPAYVHVDRILGGATGIDSPVRFVVSGSELKVRVPGGRIGCDEYRSDRIAGGHEPG